MSGALVVRRGVMAKPTGVAYPVAVLPDSPTGYWRLGELSGTNAADLGSGANAGTYTGGFTLNQAGATTDGDKAVLLDGIASSRVSIPSTFPTFAGVAVSIDMWMKTTNATLSQVLFGAMNPASTFQGWCFGFSVINAGALAYWSPTTGAWRSSTGTIVDTAWHHVGLTVPAAGTTITFYIDGAPAGTAASNRPTADANIKSIGSHRTGITPFSGTLDEVAVYPTELSAARMLAHFNAR